MLKSAKFLVCLLINWFATCHPDVSPVHHGQAPVNSFPNSDMVHGNGTTTVSAVDQLPAVNQSDVHKLNSTILNKSYKEEMYTDWTYLSELFENTINYLLEFQQEPLSIRELGMENVNFRFSDGSSLRTLKLENIVVKGLEKLNLKKCYVDFWSMSADIQVILPKLEITATYKLNGKVNRTNPINGTGDLNVNIDTIWVDLIKCGDFKSSANMCDWLSFTKPKYVKVTVTGLNYMDYTESEINQAIAIFIGKLYNEIPMTHL